MTKRPWTDIEDQYMKNHYPDELGNDIAKKLGRNISSIYNRATILKLKKSDVFKLSYYGGRGATRFKSGYKPWNKGMRGLCIGGKETQFKPGHKPHNTKFDGAVTKRPSSGYYYIRLAEGIWKELHRYLWEQKNGRIPEGFNIIFKDGNPENCIITNLEMVSNAELRKRNSIHNMYPKELKNIIILLGAAKRKIKEYEKQN